MDTNFQNLLAENERMLEVFAQSGTDLSKLTEIVFTATFQNKEDALSAKATMQTKLGRAGLLYMTCNYPDSVDLEVSKKAKPDAYSITTIENAFIHACKQHNGNDVSWEFESHF